MIIYLVPHIQEYGAGCETEVEECCGMSEELLIEYCDALKALIGGEV